MTFGRTIAVVARREVTSRVRERSFLVSTFVTVLLVAAAGALPAIIGGDGPERVTVAATADAEPVARAAAEQAGAVDLEVRIENARDPNAARAAVEAGRADAALVGDRILVDDELDTELGVLLQQASAQVRRSQALAAAGVGPDAREQVLDPPPLRVEALDPEAESEDEQRGLATIVVLVLYGQLLIYGYWISAGIVEEKSSRVVEVLLSAIRPRGLLVGKLLGLGILGFGQLLLVGLVGAITVAATGSLDVPEGAWTALAAVLGFFVLGYALYACLYAVAGAIVPRQEDLQSSTMPLTMIVLVSFFAAFAAISEPDGALAEALTFVPFCTPMIAPVRLIAGDVAAWELAVAVALMLAATAALALAAVRIYGNAVLRGGGRVKLREAWRPV